MIENVKTTVQMKEQVVFLCFLFTFIFVGNLSVLVAIILSKNRKSRMNFFIMQLAIADLSVGMLVVLTDIIWKSTVAWHAGAIGCKLVRFLQSTVMFASTYVLVAMSIDRLDAIARPMNFTGSGKRANILVCCAWGMAILFSTPMLYFNAIEVKGGNDQCWLSLPKTKEGQDSKIYWKVYVTGLALLLLIIPAMIIAVCYLVIVIVIWGKNKMDSPPKEDYKKTFKSTFKFNSPGTARANGVVLTNTQTQKKGESSTSGRGVIPKARIKTIKMTLVIVLVFILCWSPFFVFDLLDVYGQLPMSQEKVAIAVFIQSVSPLNSAANPIIYCLFSTRTCTNWRKIRICDWLARTFCCCCCDRDYPPQPSYTTNVTDYSSVGTTARGSTSRRHSNTPYIKANLNEKENEILLRHMSKASNGAGKVGRVMETQWCHSNDDLVSSV